MILPALELAFKHGYGRPSQKSRARVYYEKGMQEAVGDRTVNVVTLCTFTFQSCKGVEGIPSPGEVVLNIPTHSHLQRGFRV